MTATAMGVAIAVVVVGVGVLVVVFYLVRKQPLGPADPAAAREETAMLTTGRQELVTEDQYRVLLTMVLGDKGKAERLIAYEAEKVPSADRPQLIENAIQRLRHDRQRYG